jgi:hypothetical protein
MAREAFGLPSARKNGILRRNLLQGKRSGLKRHIEPINRRPGFDLSKFVEFRKI